MAGKRSVAAWEFERRIAQLKRLVWLSGFLGFCLGGIVFLLAWHG